MKNILIFILVLIFSFDVFAQTQQNRNLFFDGQNREYVIYVPAMYDGTQDVPLMFSFHGGGGTSTGFMNFENDMRPISDTAGFIAIYPQAAVDPTDGSNS